MTGLALAIGAISLVLFGLSLFSSYLMLYSWEHPERLESSKAPKSLLKPRVSFTVLLPARHEQKVIHDTVMRVWAMDYPRELVEVIVICSADDVETIAEAQRACRAIGSDRARVEVFHDGPINKPHGLNVGLQRSRNEIVTIFDAEDDVDRDLLRVVNTIVVREGAGVVQAGVQLMNYRDHWFSVHNCLEYFFWFKSRLHFHAAMATIPLGGNTVFLRRDLIEEAGGWDEHCLTEDADIGFRISLLGHPIRVVYDAQHVTREETPPSLSQLVKQRTRWHQGFLQVLVKGEWLRLPRGHQKLLALYTLSYPLVQALLLLAWPACLATVLWLKLPVIVAMLSFLPLYALVFQLLITLVGIVIFAREYQLPIPVTLPLATVITFLPYQIMLGLSSVRALARCAAGRNNWEKTAHLGAHRVPLSAPILPSRSTVARLEPILHELGELLEMEHRSLLVRDHATDHFSIASSRGLPEHVVQNARVAPGDGIVGWVVRERCPIVIDERPIPHEVVRHLRRRELISSIVVPIQEHDSVVAVLTLSTTAPGNLHSSKLHNLTQYLHQAIDDPVLVPGLDRVTA